MPTEPNERRRSLRVDAKQLARIRPFDPRFPPEYCTTFNVSKSGLYFSTPSAHYAIGMNVYVTSDFHSGQAMNRAVPGAVVRVEKLNNDQFGVAIQLFSNEIESASA